MIYVIPMEVDVILNMYNNCQSLWSSCPIICHYQEDVVTRQYYVHDGMTVLNLYFCECIYLYGSNSHHDIHSVLGLVLQESQNIVSDCSIKLISDYVIKDS